MAKVIKQSGRITFDTANHWYEIEYISDPEYINGGGWNLLSSTGINHYHQCLLHATFEIALKFMKEAIKEEEQFLANRS